MMPPANRDIDNEIHIKSENVPISASVLHARSNVLRLSFLTIYFSVVVYT